MWLVGDRAEIEPEKGLNTYALSGDLSIKRLAARLSTDADDGVGTLEAVQRLARSPMVARLHRIWERELTLRSPE